MAREKMGIKRDKGLLVRVSEEEHGLVKRAAGEEGISGYLMRLVEEDLKKKAGATTGGKR